MVVSLKYRKDMRNMKKFGKLLVGALLVFGAIGAIVGEDEETQTVDKPAVEETREVEEQGFDTTYEWVREMDYFFTSVKALTNDVEEDDREAYKDMKARLERFDYTDVPDTMVDDMVEVGVPLEIAEEYSNAGVQLMEMIEEHPSKVYTIEFEDAKEIKKAYGLISNHFAEVGQ